MNKPLLNDDVLLHIMSFCGTLDGQTVCTLIRTSRLFHHAGAGYLLADGVSLCTEQVESFVQFMIADGDHRLPLLHTLTLSGTMLPLFTGYILAQLFHRLARKGALCSLKLDITENILRSHPELPYAIAELPKLKSLCMYQIGWHGRTLMTHLRSELVYANLGTPYQVFVGRDDDGQIEDREDADAEVVDNGGPNQGDDDLITALHQSRQSLRELHMTYARDYSHARTLVFPNLTSLTLHAGLLDAPVTGYFSCMFPNLKEFKVYTFNPDHKSLSILDFADRRDDNMDNQAECGSWWRTLRYYDGTLEALFSLGIECRIDWVKLKSEDSALNPFMLSEALQEARPVHLCLEFWDAILFLDEEFLEIFEGEGVERLERLQIRVQATDGEEQLDGMEILDAITSRIVTPLRSLKEFRLDIECDFLGYGPGPKSKSLKRALQGVDGDDFAKRLMQASAAASGSLVSVSVKLPTSYKNPKRERRGVFGPPTRDFHSAYGAMVNATHAQDEDDKKAWSGVHRLI